MNFGIIFVIFFILISKLMAQECVDLRGTYVFYETKECNADKLKKAMQPLPIQFGEIQVEDKIRQGKKFKISQVGCSKISIEVDSTSVSFPEELQSDESSASLSVSSNEFKFKKNGPQSGCFETQEGDKWCGISNVKYQFSLKQDFRDNIIYSFEAHRFAVGFSSILPSIELQKTDLECIFEKLD